MPKFEGDMLPQENKEGEPKVIIDKADIEKVLVDHFMGELIDSKVLSGREGWGVGYSPNQYLELPDGRTVHFQLYPEDYMKYLSGDISFEEMMKSVSFSDTCGKDDAGRWKPIEVEFTGEGKLAGKPGSETWEAEHERFRKSIEESEQKRWKEKIARIEEAQAFLKEGDPVKKSVGELLMYLENFCQGQHKSGYGIYSKGIDLINNLPINTKVVEWNAIKEKDEEPSECERSSSREELKEKLLKIGKAFKVVQLNLSEKAKEAGQDEDSVYKRMAIVFEER
jgi:hypothetical protein